MPASVGITDCRQCQCPPIVSVAGGANAPAGSADMDMASHVFDRARVLFDLGLENPFSFYSWPGQVRSFSPLSLARSPPTRPPRACSHRFLLARAPPHVRHLRLRRPWFWPWFWGFPLSGAPAPFLSGLRCGESCRLPRPLCSPPRVMNVPLLEGLVAVMA